jgi:hypothetical protein
MQNETIARLAAQIARIPGPRFIGLTYRNKSANELARHVVSLGASYENALRTSLVLLRQRDHAAEDALDTRLLQSACKFAKVGGDKDMQRVAKEALAEMQESIGPERAAAAELLVSCENSLDAHAQGDENEAFTKRGMYESICPGLKVFRDGTLEIQGFAIQKKVLEPGIYRPVASSVKTLAKRAIEKTLPLGRFKTFAVDAGVLESVRIAGVAIECA